MATPVVHLRGSSALLGAERVVLELSRWMPSFGYEAVIVAPNDAGAAEPEFIREARASGVAAETLPCGGRLDLSFFGRLRRFIDARGARLLHSHGYKENFYGLLCGAGIPTVATNHLWKRTTLALRAYSWLDARLIRRFDSVVAVSDPILREMQQLGVPTAKLRHVANGVDVEPFRAADSRPVATARVALGLQADALVIGMASSLTVEKGHRFALMAIAALAPSFPDVILAVVGDGPERDAIAADARRLGIESRVVLCGRRSGMPDVLRAFDVFLLPSTAEGLPMALLEAMAAALPAVASRVGDVGTAIEPGESGALVPAGDVDAIVEALRPLLADPARRRAMGQRGREIVESRFSSREMTRRYCEIYDQLLESARSRGGR